MIEIPSRLAAVLAERCRIEREVGSGRMATICLAENLKHQREVALNVLRPELAAGRFVQGIKITAGRMRACHAD